ncbi:MAG TPA: hypothetical protein PK006_09435 [Saprospiraceae bacterium]|nr:hypothetical protein [Saprospiraceae bacterium]
MAQARRLGWQSRVYESIPQERSGDRIQGRLTHRRYEAKDGSAKYVTEIIVNEVLPFGKIQA